MIRRVLGFKMNDLMLGKSYFAQISDNLLHEILSVDCDNMIPGLDVYKL